MEFLEKIFSIKDYGETHKIMRLFGLKIKFPKNKYAKKKKESLYYYYKKNNIDIRTLPPATGQLRDIQLANLVLLKELDYVCKQNGLQYWLDGGTLLGAVRHKGFIPWDDDIDVAMLRNDYEQIINAFDKSSRNSDIYAELIKDINNNCIIKIRHKKCKFLFIDIFPWDSYGKKLTPKEQLKQSKYIKTLRKSFKNLDLSTNKLKEKLDATMKNKILTNKNNENSNYVWGIDYGHQWNNWFTDYEVLNPLKTIEFEGNIFPCMNNPNAFLKRVYGNYMSYPSKITMGHSMFIDLTEEEKETIENLKKKI